MGKPGDIRVRESLRLLSAHLLERGHQVYVARAKGLRRLAGCTAVPESQFAQRADLVVAVGGDGSMLYAARQIAGTRVPLLGINRGRLGFLADVGPEQMLVHLDEILAGRYVSENRMLLRAEVSGPEGDSATGLGLNDVVVKRHDTGRMLEYQTFVDGRYVNTHLGDGFIIATPTGSTAYALSCGGPIVEPGLDALVLAPICPHTLSDRPLVIPAARTVEVRLRAGEAEQAGITCDGELLGALNAGWSVRVRRSRSSIELVHPTGYDYFAILRNKLHWGHDTRERVPVKAPE